MGKRILSGLFIVFFLMTAGAQEHPFLIVTEDMYPELQARAAQTPWAEMKNSTEIDAQNQTYSAGSSWWTMHQVLNDCALTYILNPSLRSVCKAKILAIIEAWDSDITRLTAPRPWSNNVPPGAAFFTSVIALDIIYPDCTPAEIAEAENSLEPIYTWYNTNDNSWQLNLHAMRMIWTLYKGLPEASTHANNYYNFLMYLIEPDGFWIASPGYCFSRMGGVVSRTAKTYAMDVMEFTGLDNRYYTNHSIQEYFRWSYSFATNPAGNPTIFGDTGGFGGSPDPSLTRQYSVSRFSTEYARYASWAAGNVIPRVVGNSLYPYILMTEPLPAPKTPTSVKYESGAVFWEPNDSSESIMSAIYTQHRSEHSHDDVNSIYIFGYGEHLLMNSGVNYSPSYPGQTPAGDEWRAAFLQNSVTINNAKTHAKRYARDGGILEGFIGNSIEYALGHSDDALGNGIHLRTLIQVQPQQPDANGYFILMDEVQADDPAHSYQVNLHPNRIDDPVEISANTEYEAEANFYLDDAEGGETITLFMATPPAGVVFKDGYFGTYAGSTAARYIESTYPTDTGGAGRCATILFPHDDTHAKAAMTRISPAGATGAQIDHGGGVLDVTLVSDGTTVITSGQVSYQAVGCLYRSNGTDNAYYFTRQAASFDDGNLPRRGFEAAGTVSVFMENKTGQIVSSGTDVTFYYPDIAEVQLDGVPVTATLAEGSATVTVPAGTAEVTLSTTSTTGDNKSKEPWGCGLLPDSHYPDAIVSILLILMLSGMVSIRRWKRMIWKLLPVRKH